MISCLETMRSEQANVEEKMGKKKNVEEKYNQFTEISKLTDAKDILPENFDL